MSNTFGMEIIHPKNDLGVYSCSLSLFNSFLIDNFFEQVTSFSILHDKIKLFGCFDNLIKLNNKRMSEFFHDFKLSSNSDNIGVFEDKIFLKDFDSNILLGDFMHGEFDFSKITFSKSFRDDIAI